MTRITRIDALKFLLSAFLLLLPWQTIWIFRETFVGGIKLEYSTLGFYATEALLWLIIIFFIIFYLKKLQVICYKLQDFKWTKDRIFVLAVLSLISYLLLSVFWSNEPSLALQQSLHAMEAFLLFFVLWLGPLKKEEAIKWLVLGSILPCVLGIWQFLTQSTFASTLLGLASHPTWEAGTSVVASNTIGRWLRAYGLFAHPNVFGGYLVIVLLFYCSIVRNEKKWLQLIVYSLLLTALFFTFSRAAWGAAIVSCILYLITCNIYQRNKLHVTRYTLQILLILILTTTFFPLVQTRFTGNSVSESHSITDRVSGYSEAWEIFKQNPIFGVGAGNYTVAARQLNLALKPWEIQPAHNAFVLFAVEGGVVGVGLLVIIFVSCILYLITYNLHQKNKLHVTRYTLQIISFLLLASLDHYLYSSYIGLMLSALFFGLILRRSEKDTVSPQLIHCESFDTTSVACHNTLVK